MAGRRRPSPGSRRISPRSQQACRAPGAQARSVQRSPSRLNHAICSVCNGSLREQWLPPHLQHHALRLRRLLLRHPHRRQRSLSRSLQSAAGLASKRFAWRGRSCVDGSTDCPTSTAYNSSKSCASGIQGDLAASSTGRTYDTSISDGKTLACAARSSAQRRIDAAATNRGVDVPTTSSTTGRKWWSASRNAPWILSPGWRHWCRSREYI